MQADRILTEDEVSRRAAVLARTGRPTNRAARRARAKELATLERALRRIERQAKGKE